jgi:hypothetical protein
VDAGVRPRSEAASDAAPGALWRSVRDPAVGATGPVLSLAVSIDRALDRAAGPKPVRGAGRVAWMDSVRGTAMILLLLYHCTAVPQTLGMPMPAPLRWFSAFFMPYRMPTHGAVRNAPGPVPA